MKFTITFILSAFTLSVLLAGCGIKPRTLSPVPPSDHEFPKQYPAK